MKINTLNWRKKKVKAKKSSVQDLKATWHDTTSSLEASNGWMHHKAYISFMSIDDGVNNRISTSSDEERESYT